MSVSSPRLWASWGQLLSLVCSLVCSVPGTEKGDAQKCFLPLYEIRHETALCHHISLGSGSLVGPGSQASVDCAV